MLSSVADIRVDILEAVALANPSYVGFFGSNGEAVHDKFDEICVSKNLDTLTTWHVDEELDEVAWEFYNLHYRISSESGSGYVIDIGDEGMIKGIRKIIAGGELGN